MLMPARPRPLFYVAGAFLTLFALYSLLSLRRATDVEIVKTTNPTIIPQQDLPIGDDDFRQDSTPVTTVTVVTERPDFPAASTAVENVPQHTPQAPSQSIGQLIEQANEAFDGLLSKHTVTVEAAAAAYRQKRGRHPPPGFDRWFQYAMEHNAVMVEDFWDQIYHDTDPFWAIAPAMIRAQTRQLGMTVTVKDGKVTDTADWFWHEIWGRMINEVAQHLPDMLIALNPMDESRLLVPWEQMNEYMTTVNQKRHIVDKGHVVQVTNGWGSEVPAGEPSPVLPDPAWNTYTPYTYARAACPPDSAARKVSSALDAETIMVEHMSAHPALDVTAYFDAGFVVNYTEASDFCTDASIGGFHGALMEPLTVSNSHVLLPMFGGSKFHVNNEILLPAPMYWNGEERFGGDAHGDTTPWNNKHSTVLWRGTATGGINKPFTWHLFHRHRFVAVTNGTKYDHAQRHHDLVFNDLWRASAVDDLNPTLRADLGKWLSPMHDVAFTDLFCEENEPEGHCWYTNDEYALEPAVNFLDQFTVKYLPDIDGNSFSGRYRAFLMSNSLPIKATIYREWHDSRLVPWKHFVPMNNRFSDYYRIMQHFVGAPELGLPGHDEQAEAIATAGREWSEKVLRRVDMQIYVFRLLLEFGRITDDNRDQLGWVGDL